MNGIGKGKKRKTIKRKGCTKSKLKKQRNSNVLKRDYGRWEKGIVPVASKRATADAES